MDDYTLIEDDHLVIELDDGDYLLVGLDEFEVQHDDPYTAEVFQVLGLDAYYLHAAFEEARREDVLVDDGASWYDDPAQVSFSALRNAHSTMRTRRRLTFTAGHRRSSHGLKTCSRRGSTTRSSAASGDSGDPALSEDGEPPQPSRRPCSRNQAHVVTGRGTA